EVSDHHLRLSKPQPTPDLLPHRQSSGRGQGHANGRLERVGLRPEAQVVRAEVVAPLADQMRLVNNEQTWSSTMQRLARLRVRQLLRGHEDESLGVTSTVERSRPRSRGLLRVQDDRGQPRLAEMSKLIVLQRDQR